MASPQHVSSNDLHVDYYMENSYYSGYIDKDLGYNIVNSQIFCKTIILLKCLHIKATRIWFVSCVCYEM